MTSWRERMDALRRERGSQEEADRSAASEARQGEESLPVAHDRVMARLDALREEFPGWFFGHAAGPPGGWVARLSNLTVRARTLGELEQVMRDGYRDR